jgi:hypothetical protein
MTEWESLTARRGWAVTDRSVYACPAPAALLKGAGSGRDDGEVRVASIEDGGQAGQD